MESRLRIFLLRTVIAALCLSMLSGCFFGRKDSTDSTVDALEPVIDPQVDRRKIKPADIDTEDFEIGVFAGFMSVEDFGSNAVYGLKLDYHVSESFFFEATYGTTDTSETSFELLSGGAQLLTDEQREYTYYDLSIGWNLFPGEVFIGKNWAFNTTAYLIAGAGNTDFADDTYFTVVLGGGYRVLATDFLGLHFDVRDHMFDTDLLGEDKTTHNIEFNIGLTFFF
ncbi:MAG: outer membrane beta-barrel domain-containing protein [Woeseiaceae bacterium]